MKKLLCVGCAMTFGSLFALTDLPSVFDASTGFDVHKSADAYSGGSFIDCGADPAVANAKWSSGLSIHSGTNYYSKCAMYAYPPVNGLVRLPGGENELFVLDGNTIEVRGTYSFTCDRRFVALPGTYFRFTQAGYTFTSSSVEVRSTTAKPFTICMRCNTTSKNATLSFPLEGPETAVLWLPYTYEGGSDRGNTLHTYTYKGDASKYYGKILVDGKYVNNGYMKLALGTAELGGTVVLTNRSIIGKANSCAPKMKGLVVSEDSYLPQDGVAYSFGDLVFADGGKVLYSVVKPGLITVTNSFAHGDNPLTLDFNNQKVFSWSIQNSIDKKPTSTNELFRFAAGINVSTNDFKLVNVARAIGGYLPVPYLTIVENQDGTKSLSLTHRPVVVALKNMNMATDDEIAAWSDDRMSHPDADYLLAWISAAQSRTGSNMETPMYAQTWNEGKNTFGGGSLTVTGGILWSYAPDCHIDQLVIAGGQVAKNTGAIATMTGRILILGTEAEPSRFHPTVGKLQIASDISGSASSVIRFYETAPIELLGDNGGFAGRFRLEGAATYSVANGTALGGGNTAYLYNAIDLNNAAVTLAATADVTLENANRGVLVRKPATVSVDDGHVMRVDAPFTFASVLTKSGAGTLAFGAAPRFIDGLETTEPTEGTNGLVVAEGAVEVSDADALNGLALNIASTATVVIDDKPGDLHDFGACLTRWANPLAGSSVVNVQLGIAVDDERKTVTYSRGVMTFATEAEALAAKARLCVKTSPRGYRAALSVVETERDGATVYTIMAECNRQGIVLIFK